MKLVEFTGLPGSGKSTILPIVKSYLRILGFDVFDSKDIILCSNSFPFNKRPFKRFISILPPKLKNKIIGKLDNNLYLREQYQLKYILKNLETFNFILGLIVSRPIPVHHKRLSIKWFLKTSGSYQIAYESLGNNSILILDEGFAHRILTLLVSVEEKEINFLEIEKYLGIIPKICTLIKVETDEVLCKKRIIARKLPRRLEGCTDDEINKYLLRSKTVIDYATSLLTKSGTKIVTLNNSSEQLIEEDIKIQLFEKLRKFEDT